MKLYKELNSNPILVTPEDESMVRNIFGPRFQNFSDLFILEDKGSTCVLGLKTKKSPDNRPEVFIGYEVESKLIRSLFITQKNYNSFALLEVAKALIDNPVKQRPIISWNKTSQAKLEIADLIQNEYGDEFGTSRISQSLDLHEHYQRQIKKGYVKQISQMLKVDDLNQNELTFSREKLLAQYQLVVLKNGNLAILDSYKNPNESVSYYIDFKGKRQDSLYELIKSHYTRKPLAHGKMYVLNESLVTNNANFSFHQSPRHNQKDEHIDQLFANNNTP